MLSEGSEWGGISWVSEAPQWGLLTSCRAAAFLHFLYTVHELLWLPLFLYFLLKPRSPESSRSSIFPWNDASLGATVKRLLLLSRFQRVGGCWYNMLVQIAASLYGFPYKCTWCVSSSPYFGFCANRERPVVIKTRLWPNKQSPRLFQKRLKTMHVGWWLLNTSEIM